MFRPVIAVLCLGSVLSRYCSYCTLRSLFYMPENKLIGYANDSTLMAVVPSHGVRVTVAEYLIRDLGRVLVSGVTFGGRN